MEQASDNSVTFMAERPSLRKPIRKQRIPLSCNPCRSKKLKCNREQPCQNCTVRDKPKTCVYEGSPLERVRAPATVTHPPRVEDMQQRIDRLESLVTSLVMYGQDQTGKNGLTPPDEGHNGSEVPISTTNIDSSHGNETSSALDENITAGDVQPNMGVMEVIGKHSIYRESTQWCDILEELQELKSLSSQFKPCNQPILPDGIVDGVGLISGIANPVNRKELLATLPPKPSLDKLIAHFFDNDDAHIPSFQFVHPDVFKKEYERHWVDPTETTIMWLGLLFSILTLTMLSYTQIGDEPAEYEGISDSLYELYRLRTAQCLMLGDITKCASYTLETMVYNIVAEQARKKEGQTRTWMMVGLLVRVAIQMGYHRDPSHYPEISVFDGEMRRRVWSLIQGFDILMAFHVGLPSSLVGIESDTRSPRNLYTWELFPEMTELPPSRPLTEYTTFLYLICKRELLLSIEKIIQYLTSLSTVTYSPATINSLSASLTKAYEIIPPCLQLYPESDTITQATSSTPEKTSIRNQKRQLFFLYHQGLCTLHRKFLSQSRTNHLYYPSRVRCIESSLALLSLQRLLDEDFKETGRRIGRHWYAISNLTHEFVLAVMILVADYRYRKEGVERERGERGVEKWMGESEQRWTVDALVAARGIWREAQGVSSESKKVYVSLNGMLEKLGVKEEEGEGGVGVENGSASEEVDVQELNTGQPSPGEENAENDADFSMDMDIDWAAWDQFIEGANFSEAYGNINPE